MANGETTLRELYIMRLLGDNVQSFFEPHHVVVIMEAFGVVWAKENPLLVKRADQMLPSTAGQKSPSCDLSSFLSARKLFCCLFPLI